jgi:hypothetical protein
MKNIYQMDIMGRRYSVKLANKKEVQRLDGAPFYCDLRNRVFYINVDLSDCDMSDQEILRFIAFKAFMKECGYAYDNDEFIHYLAVQFDRINALYKDARTIMSDDVFKRFSVSDKSTAGENFIVNVVGVEYEIKLKHRIKNAELDVTSGLCYCNDKYIEIELTRDASDTDEGIDYYWTTVILHEMIHALMFETGVGPECAWGSTNEVNVDFIASQYPKLAALDKLVSTKYLKAMRNELLSTSDGYANANFMGDTGYSVEHAPVSKRRAARA